MSKNSSLDILKAVCNEIGFPFAMCIYDKKMLPNFRLIISYLT